MTTQAKTLSSTAVKGALVDALKKMAPRYMAKNPVMFVVLIGTVICIATTGIKIASGLSFGFELITSLILFVTLWFANFAESVAEARGRGQAASLRATKQALVAFKKEGSEFVKTEATDLRKNDVVRVQQDEYIPADGEIIEGVATVNESAVTGESAAVLREANTDHSGVIGGTKLLTGEVLIKVSDDPGNSFLDKMIGLVEGAERKKTPNEIALTVLLAALTAVFLIVVMTLPALASFVDVELNYIMLIALLVCLIPTTIGGLLPAIGIAGMNRALTSNIIAKSGKAVEVAGDIDILLLDKTGTITYGDRQATDFIPAQGVGKDELIQAAYLASVDDPTPEGKSIVKLAKQNKGLDESYPEGAEFIPFSPTTRLSGLKISNDEFFVKGSGDAIHTFEEEKGVSWPNNLNAEIGKVAKQGATPLIVADQDRILGVIALSDVIKPGVAERFARLRKLGVKTVMVTGDNHVTAGAIAAEAGVDDFIAEAKPEDKLSLIREEQAKGHLVAMVGDGTNDAPALAQADVGLAMNSGTQAAKEAGNMVDLDSDPTKLLQVVEVGKQLLITRGAMTTFSLANDVAKYFAIIPAVFASALPLMSTLDIMNLGSPQSAVISALIFNALIIPALVPLALRGVKLKSNSAEKILRNNMLIFGLGGIVLPFIAIKLIDLVVSLFI
ncbi:K+-transporting ATPase ATPase B chain [Idiomarina loihiensis]|uniref:potassium-transporting ATPase subunit KdpB n=1 Tax=Idiomarina TaxID=135575 RepID=UPI000D70BB43|nr:MULTISPECIES: potassium-transporting ATPase subunit KdpB [Idiomarina]PWW40369.1 K+-transporting ATPase ATPase B chain [Idiomarina loihiensis]TDP50060.1 K+-transporting ATPase ATPase B chain [Idiomarina loihiensis]TDS24588.1 K+-transporting ATPase ATPase B chain [Idiomarina sp. H2]